MQTSYSQLSIQSHSNWNMISKERTTIPAFLSQVFRKNMPGLLTFCFPLIWIVSVLLIQYCLACCIPHLHTSHIPQVARHVDPVLICTGICASCKLLKQKAENFNYFLKLISVSSMGRFQLNKTIYLFLI